MLAQLGFNPFRPTLTGTISGRVFEDRDGDGAFDPGEPARANRTVFLDVDNDGVLDSGERRTSTGTNGTYSFTGVLSGPYAVRCTAAPGWRQTRPASGAYVVAPASGQRATGLDFGETRNVLVSGTVFQDLNRNGAKDAGEGALQGRRVYVDRDKDGVFDAGEPSALTDSAGNYRLTGLAAGTYRVREVLPSGWRFTRPSAGFYDLTLSSSQVAADRNFGNLPA